MTGFAAVTQETSAGDLTVSLRSVNHRGLDLNFHHLGDFAPYENAMRTVLRTAVARGHVEVRVSLLRGTTGKTAIYNRDQLSRYVQAYWQAANDFDITVSPDLNALLSMPGVFSFSASDSADPLPDGFEAELLEALGQASTQLNAVREREGLELLKAFTSEAASIERAITHVAELRAQAAGQFRARLQERLTELLGRTGISEARLVEETAILADRSDVEEEITRLKIHTRELSALFRAGGQIGKRIDFLLQEMNRETNTILSKTSGAAEASLKITNYGLAVKAHVEKIREQALNLE
jgi:uncharacterized protein (TIGR00255 family)